MMRPEPPVAFGFMPAPAVLLAFRSAIDILPYGLPGTLSDSVVVSLSLDFFAPAAVAAGPAGDGGAGLDSKVGSPGFGEVSDGFTTAGAGVRELGSAAGKAVALGTPPIRTLSELS